MRNPWIGAFAALGALIASLIFWGRLPAEVTTHWNLRGEPDGSSSRLVAALAGPGIILGLSLLFRLLPRLDPREGNYERFRDVYWLVVNGVLVWVMALHVALLASASGAAVSFEHVVALSSAVLLVVMGNSLGRVRSNWFLGIRTPWTLDNPEVWRRTHRMAAWLFVLAGIVTGVALLFPNVNPLGIALWSTVGAAIVSAVLSLIFWFQEKRS